MSGRASWCEFARRFIGTLYLLQFKQSGHTHAGRFFFFYCNSTAIINIGASTVLSSYVPVFSPVYSFQADRPAKSRVTHASILGECHWNEIEHYLVA
jgi:hypothetical protein